MTSDSIAEVSEISSTTDSNDPDLVNTELKKSVAVLETLMGAVKQQVLGRNEVIELVIIALISDGHVLLEDYPGSGKTTLAKALGEAIVSGDDPIEQQADDGSTRRWGL